MSYDLDLERLPIAWGDVPHAAIESGKQIARLIHEANLHILSDPDAPRCAPSFIIGKPNGKPPVHLLVVLESSDTRSQYGNVSLDLLARAPGALTAAPFPYASYEWVMVGSDAYMTKTHASDEAAAAFAAGNTAPVLAEIEAEYRSIGRIANLSTRQEVITVLCMMPSGVHQCQWVYGRDDEGRMVYEAVDDQVETVQGWRDALESNIPAAFAPLVGVVPFATSPIHGKVIEQMMLAAKVNDGYTKGQK